MGVVRREGDWRLEKREDGVYAITHQHNLQVKVFTPKYTPGTLDSPMIDASPVREVDSYSEAEGLFEEMAHGDRPGGMTTGGGDGPILVDDGAGGLDLGLDIGGSEKNQDESGENLHLAVLRSYFFSWAALFSTRPASHLDQPFSSLEQYSLRAAWQFSDGLLSYSGCKGQTKR